MESFGLEAAMLMGAVVGFVAVVVAVVVAVDKLNTGHDVVSSPNADAEGVAGKEGNVDGASSVAVNILD